MSIATPVVFLFGPTAVGKTDVLTRLAGLPIEVISADSMQVYRGMDIGTAKPDPALREALAHHLIDILDPHERFDVGRFVDLADSCIAAITARGRIPVVSGGTGYYFRHLLFGLPRTPQIDPAVRERLQHDLETEGLAVLRSRLERVDPQSAARIDPADPYRTVRALEIYEQTGTPRSAFRVPAEPRRDLAATVIELYRERPVVRARIADRVAAMFGAGLRREVESLVDSGVVASDPGMRAIGYREFFRDDGSLVTADDDTQIQTRIVTATRRYAKRQVTFFSGLPGRTPVHADDAERVARLVRDAVRP
ncbi:MAG: tRNA (adenosine(37)-N6)-dimethylallyltransferase MiaA [Spirochaetaceae bacterium]|nr:MAG: tRNA (adenosine(37)-N6)-dimethylallyltransferase MiaA [Spirochaetaceae bacterium]